MKTFSDYINIDDETESTSELLEDLDNIDNFFVELKNDSISIGSPAYTLIGKAEDLWSTYQDFYGLTKPMPIVSSNENGDILFSFNKEDEYLGIRLLEEGIEIYYEDFNSNERELINLFLVEEILDNSTIQKFID